VPKSILVVAHDLPLRESRVHLLQQEGYIVKSVETDDDAMAIMENQQFDLVLLGRRSLLPRKQIDQRLREKYPDLLTLKIENLLGMERSIYPSRMTDSEPGHVLEALHHMLGDRVRLVPLEPLSDPPAS
jgi:hypothetical protein